jgi:hypothetical protein
MSRFASIPEIAGDRGHYRREKATVVDVVLKDDGRAPFTPRSINIRDMDENHVTTLDHYPSG